MRSQRGQSLIEFCVGLGLLIALLFVGGPMIYFGFAKIWVRHCSYEALICVIERSPDRLCRDDLRQQITRMLKIGDIETRWVRKVHQRVHARVKFRISPHYVISEGVTLRDDRINGTPL